MAKKNKKIFIFSVILSIFFHFSVLGPLFLKKAKPEHKSFSTHIKSKTSYLSEISEIEVSLESSLKFNYRSKSITQTFPKHSEYNVLTSDQIKDKVLKLIYKKISKLWDSSIPPAQGNIKIRLFLNRSGEVEDIKVLSTSSPDVLKRFVISLIKRASPFEEIKNYTKTQNIVVDCVFLIR